MGQLQWSRKNELRKTSAQNDDRESSLLQWSRKNELRKTPIILVVAGQGNGKLQWSRKNELRKTKAFRSFTDHIKASMEPQE